MDEEFIRNRITELRLKKGVSEYQMSMELGQNRSYIQAISSGRSMPSMKQFLNICEYFEITPLQFFDAQENNPQLIKKALDGMRKMSDDDLIMLIGFISRLNTEKTIGGSKRPVVSFFILCAAYCGKQCLWLSISPQTAC